MDHDTDNLQMDFQIHYVYLVSNGVNFAFSLSIMSKRKPSVSLPLQEYHLKTVVFTLLEWFAKASQT